MPDPINVNRSVFNSQPYNGPTSPAKPYSWVQRAPVDFFAQTGQLPAARRPQVLTQLSATPSDVTDTAVTVTTNLVDNVPRSTITGGFAAVRSRRVLHQYRIDYWGASGIIAQAVQSSAADPTQVQIDTAWQQFQLFSYLPAALMPSAQEFGDLITPSKNVSNVKNALPLMGINTTVPANPAPTTIDVTQANEPVTTSTLPDPVPFANNLSQFCALI